jgi:hypothetical protein
MKLAKLINYLIVFWLTGLLISGSAAQAAKKAEASQYMTKGEAVQLLSATDFVKQKIGELLSWTIGYDISKVSRVRLTPTINYIKILPKRVPPDGRTIVELQASVDDPAGLTNISGVRADLSSIGRLPNTMLVDNGLFGDKKAGDGIYSLQTTVSLRTLPGNRDIPVAVANKKGWLALAKTSLDIQKNPNIIEIRINPDTVLADGASPVTLTVRIDNPGRLEDVRAVAANLKALGLSERTMLKNDGSDGDVMAGDNTWSVLFSVAKELPAGSYPVAVEVTNLAGGIANGQTTITVNK